MSIRVLDAEWAYLNRPDALAQMNQRFLSLTPIATKQLQTSLTDIPMRPAPPPQPAPAPARRRSLPAAANSVAGCRLHARPKLRPCRSRLPGSGSPVMPAALEKPAGGSRSAKPSPPAKTVGAARRPPPRRIAR